jgi:hypothetical protein
MLPQLRNLVLAAVIAVSGFMTIPTGVAEPTLAQRVLRDIGGIRGVSDAKIVDDDTISAKVGTLLSQINLGNLRAELADVAPDKRAGVYRHYVASYRRSLLETVRGFRPVDPGNLLPIIRNLDYFGGTSPEQMPGYAHRTIAPGLFVLLAAHEQRLIKAVGEEMLSGTGLTFEGAVQRAQANLERRGAGVRFRPVLAKPPIWAAELKQDFGSSLILSEGLLRRAVAQAGGPVVLGIPERGLLYFAAASDPQAALLLEGLVRKLHAEAVGNSQLSGTIFYSDGGPARVR